MPNTLFIGKVYHRFDELPSTNDYVQELLAKGRPPEGMVVRAASQSAGRGQFGSQWQSAPGENLLLSVVLYPNWLEASAQFYLSMAVALALRDLSLQCAAPGILPSAWVKWPNDLYLDDRKCAGILIQNTLSGRYLQSAVVGIGLNVNQTHFGSDVPNPTSLALVLNQRMDIEVVAAGLFECLERRYLQLKSGQRTALKADYEQHLYRQGQMARYSRPDGWVFEGAIQGVTEEGRLRIALATGQEETFGMKELSIET